MLQGLGRDFQIAGRRLIATPLFTTFAVLSLAVGIGVTTVAYSFVESVFFKALAIHEPERAVFVMTSNNGRLGFHSVISRPDFDDLRASQKSFSSLAASWAFNPSLAGPATTELVRAEAITGDYFRTLGVTAALGRTILPADDESAAAVAVLGHALWRARFASDPRVVGQTVRIGGLPFEIIGVASRSFSGAAGNFGFYGTRVWVPLGTAPRFASAVKWFAAPARPGAVARPDRERRDLTVVGRLRADVGVDRAIAELSRLGDGLDSSYPNTIPIAGTQVIPRRGWNAQTIADVRTEVTENAQRLGIVVAGLVLLVLVVACTNLSNLVLARGTTRHQELAVRRALGATRWRLVREQTAESLLIAVAGGFAAYIVMRGLAAGLTVDLPLSRSTMMSIQPVVDGPCWSWLRRRCCCRSWCSASSRRFSSREHGT